MKIALCEDRQQDSALLESHIRRYLEAHQMQASLVHFPSGEAFLESFQAGEYTLVFLDIFMGELDGMETARRMRQIDSDCAIVFTTTSTDFALEGYSVRASHYLIKPVSYDALCTAMSYCEERLQRMAKYITVTSNREELRVPLREIRYIEAQGKLCVLHLAERQVKTYLPLDRLEEQLDSPDFLRCHRSFLVHLRQVREWKSHRFLLADGEEIPIGRAYFSQVQHLYQEFLVAKMRETG